MKISVIGLGMYSLALTKMLAKKEENEIIIWTDDKNKTIKSIIDIDLPKTVTVSPNMGEVLENTDIIYIACASKYVDSVLKNMAPYYKKNTPICIASKGIEESTESLLSDVVTSILHTSNIAVISGPTFAIDMLNNDPTALALGAKNCKVRNMVMKTLANDTLKLRPTKDLIGIQVCGAIKNVIAIAAGIIKGLGYGESTHALLINSSLHDIKEIIYYLGGNEKTILSYAGVGDLLLTCSTKKSRNYHFGFIIGSTKNKKEINKFLCENTVEGYNTLDTIYRILKKKNIDIKIINILYEIVYNEEDPSIIINAF